ncbi:MAG: 4-hydroxy-tetrahydrodipicolinate reductase [Gammaproteobacteria bacterium]|nr:4-hydroxy-tetrahydrodipicolinate reductase [Gammaproteobacteria bacterium]
MMRVAIAGASGRMGRTLIQAIAEDGALQLGAAIEQPGAPSVGADAGEVAGVGALGVAIADSVVAVIEDFETLINFTVPEATLAAVDACHDAGRGLVIGTTGFDAAGLARIRAAAEAIPILMAPNMSIGVNLMFRLVEQAARALGDEVDIEVVEAHHRHKIDAPSGTAVRLGELVAGALGRTLEEDAVYGRQGETGARSRRTIGFSALRGGDIVGDHTVMFAGGGERLEITHRAASRMNFALGALRAAKFLADKGHGLFDMQDVLSF